MKHEVPTQPRRWFGRRPAGVSTAEPAVDVSLDPAADLFVDLRAPDHELPDDVDSVLARLARLRDAGLMTPAEYEDERKRLQPNLPSLHLDEEQEVSDGR